MRVFSLCVLFVYACAGVVTADEPTQVAEQSPEEIVKAGLSEFHEAMRSGDAEVRDATFDAVMPDKALLEKLFGDDANLIWPKMSTGMKQMKDNVGKAKEQLDRQGKIVSIELVDVRTDDVSGRRFRLVLQMIPADIPVYRAITKYEKASGGSASYMVVDGKMRWMPGFENMPELIEAQKNPKK